MTTKRSLWGIAMSHIDETGVTVGCKERDVLCDECELRVRRNTDAYIASGTVGLPEIVDSPFPPFPEVEDVGN